MTDVFMRFDVLFKCSKLYKKQKKALKILHNFSSEVIRQRRQELAASNNDERTENFDPDDIGIRKKEAFLDILLKSAIDGTPLSDAEIREEVDTLMFEVKLFWLS